MLLKNENSRFEMTVIGYQFPEILDEEYDSNWLIIEIRASSLEGSWSISNPCMLTIELADLADWLDDVANGNGTINTRLDFFEPCLCFEVTGLEPKKLCVHLNEELKPVSLRDNDSKRDTAICIEFKVTPQALKDAAASLRSYLRFFPIRAGAKKTLCNRSITYIEID